MGIYNALTIRCANTSYYLKMSIEKKTFYELPTGLGNAPRSSLPLTCGQIASWPCHAPPPCLVVPGARCRLVEQLALLRRSASGLVPEFSKASIVSQLSMGTASIERRACRRLGNSISMMTLEACLSTAALMCVRPELPGCRLYSMREK